MTDPDLYLGPSDPNEVTDDDVHDALAFLIAIEPDLDNIDSVEEYEAATSPAMSRRRRSAR